MDTGHVKQVATFEKLLGFCNAQGAMFNPSKEALKATALSSLLTSARQSIEAVRAAHTAYKNVVIERNETFNKIPSFMTRIVNTLATYAASPGTVEEAYRFVNKFYKPYRKPVDAPSASEQSLPTATRTTSQLDFDSKAENFMGLVKLVSEEAVYKPNEGDLKVESLMQVANQLYQLNSGVVQAQVNLDNARAQRNTLLYNSTGIHGLARAIKRYVKGVFGYKSVAYNQISGLRFVNKKIP